MLLEELQGIVDKREPLERRSVFVAAWPRAACHRGRRRLKIFFRKPLSKKTG